MYNINNKKNCQIYNSSLFQDLVGYSVYEDSAGPKISYAGGFIETVNLNFSAIESFIDTAVPEIAPRVWRPAIIQNESNITNKPLFDKKNTTNTILGIEAAVKFNAKFQNWQTLDTNNSPKPTSMLTNWYITAMIPTFTASYGVLYWYRFSNPEQTVPHGQLVKDDRKYDMWISDGEVFSYSDGYVDAKRSPVSKTYLSPLLMPIYREIYNTLTLRRPKSSTPNLTRKQALCLQKLCYFLSTHPLIDRTTVNVLNTQSIHDIVQSYIDSDQTDEISTLRTALYNICIEYEKNHLIDHPQTKQTNRHNYIHNKTDLVKKILSKYGASLYIDNDTILKYNSQLPNGPHAFVGVGSVSVADKTLPLNTVLYNNFKIDIGNMHYETDISDTGSVVKLKGTGFANPIEIPLVDIAVQRYARNPFYLGVGRQITFDSPETVIENIFTTFDNEATYFWEQVSGPQCLRFDDYKKDNFRVGRYITSTDSNPDIFIRESGTYRIRCTRNYYGIIESDEITITTEGAPIDSPVDNIPDAVVYNKIIEAVPRKIGFNKYGMVSFVDTNNYVKDNYTLQSIAEFDLMNTFKLKDVNIDISGDETFVPQKRNADLKFHFLVSNGNTKILVNAISLDNARDSEDIYGQCDSFYQEKIYRQTPNPFLPQVGGSSDFIRDISRSYQFIYFDDMGQSFRAPSNPSSPQVISTVNAPTVFPYGGYSRTKRDNIGIHIPGHPPPECKLPYLFVRNEITEPPVSSRTASSGIYCHLKEIKPSGSSHYTSFSKGFFHPAIGWIGKDHPDYGGYSGKSAVIDYSIDYQKTFTFKGFGLYNLTPAQDASLQTYTSQISIVSNPRSESEQYFHKWGYRNYNAASNLDPNFVVDQIDSSWESIYDYNNDCGVSSTTSYGFTNLEFLDSLSIKDIEVKINFLNYPNPKNLIVWLDVINTSISPNVASSALLDSRDIASFSDNSELTSYYNNINAMNDNIAGRRRIYLLNQEHISNYSSNFSLAFSDNENKNKTTNKQNYTHSTQVGNVSCIGDKEKLQPTLYAFGYDDLEASKYINILKTNRLNNINNSFLKFKNIPLKDTQFVLNIALASPVDHSNKVMDNLLINNIALGATRTENLAQSDTLNNSICNWEIKIHTDKIVQNSNKDVLGKINYAGFHKDGNLSLPGGYNFLGNFKDTPYFIPAVNINAPYDYMAHINQCSYTDEDIGKGVSFRPPVFPSLLSYLLVGMGIFGVSSAMGALGALYAVNAAFANGGRNDPIINYFIETRLANQAATANSQYYKPVYSSEYFGSSGRAVVSISTDNTYWYNVEVPIFKASNSPILTKNIYKYIKLYGDVLPGISNFNYSVIRNYIDLDLAPIVHLFENNVDVLSGLLSLDVNNVFSEGDLVLLKGQSIEQDNGYYIIRPGFWDKVPSINSNYFLQQNSPGRLFSHDNLNNQKHILIDGIRAYNFFDFQETIEFQLKEGKAFAKVDDKSFIYTTSGIKTVLTLNIPITQEGTISKTLINSNVIWLYKDDVTSVGPINNWMLEKTRKEKGELLDPYNFSVAYGEGSFNSGTDKLDPETLYKISFTDNEIRETHKLLNNQENDKIKLNQLTVWSGDASQILSFTESDPKDDLLKAYSYTATQFLNRPFSTGDVIVAPTGNLNTLDIARLSNIIINDFSNHNFMELKSNKFKNTTTISPTGAIYIENDLKNKNGSLVTTDDGLYWIHLDPEQECKLNDELSVKILKRTVIEAIPTASTDFGGVIPGDESHIVPLSSYLGTPNGIDESLDVLGTTYKYVVSEAAMLKEKAKWPSSIDWTAPETFKYGADMDQFGFLDEAGDSKKVSIARLDSPKDMLLITREEYLRPKGTNAKNIGKVKNRIDLSSTDTLYVKFRNIPRKIKGIDSEKFVRYIYTKKGGIGKSVMPAGSIGRIENNFTCWHCINSSGEYMTDIPAYYKLANEMRYRAFFGSNDGIENKNIEYLDSKNDWEWIPYEYFTPPCSANIGFNLNHSPLTSIDLSGGGYAPVGEIEFEDVWNSVTYQRPGGIYYIKEDKLAIIWSYIYKKEIKIGEEIVFVDMKEEQSLAPGLGRRCDPRKPEHNKVLRYYTISFAQNQLSGTVILDNQEDYAEVSCVLGCTPVSGPTICTKIEEIINPVSEIKTTITETWTVASIMRHTFTGSLPEYQIAESNDGSPITDIQYAQTNNIGNANRTRTIVFWITHRLHGFPPTIPENFLYVNPVSQYSFVQTSEGEGPGIIKTRLIIEDSCEVSERECSKTEPPTVFRTFTDRGDGIPLTELSQPEHFRNASVIITSNHSAFGNIVLTRIPCTA